MIIIINKALIIIHFVTSLFVTSLLSLLNNNFATLFFNVEGKTTDGNTAVEPVEKQGTFKKSSN